jgi:hypothetical protein
MALALTSVELNQMIDRLAPDLRSLVEDYDDSKYPAAAYDLLIGAFKNPRDTSDGDIERALRWKYGHWRKINYPIAQLHLAERIAGVWKQFSKQNTQEPESIFGYWMAALKGTASTPYITVTFLLHLLRPDQFPIIDQHTFRAMNWLIKGVRPEWSERKAPRNFTDLTTYTEFFDSLHIAWQSRDHAPSRSDLDRGLMVFGQGLKTGEFPRTHRLDEPGKQPAVTTHQRIERATKPAKCPVCNHRPLASILYGLPAFSERLDDDLKAGRVTLGGCCVSNDDPSWACSKCGVDIYRT